MDQVSFQAKALEAEQLMLHPLLPKPIGLSPEENAFFQLLDNEAIHRDIFILNEASLKRKKAFGRKLLWIEKEKSPFLLILLKMMKEGSKNAYEEMKIQSFTSQNSTKIHDSPKNSSFFTESFFLETGIEGCGEEEAGEDPEPRRIEDKKRMAPFYGFTIKGEELLEEEVLNVELSNSFMSEERGSSYHDLVYEIVKSAQLLKNSNKIGIHLYLKTEILGPINVRLIMDESKGIEIEFVVEGKEALTIIKKDLATLKANLEGANLLLKGIDVKIKGEEEKKDGWSICPIDLDLLASKVNYIA